MEFVIIREEFSDDEEEVKPDLGTVKPINMPQSPEDSTAGSSQADYEVCSHYNSFIPGSINEIYVYILYVFQYIL